MNDSLGLKNLFILAPLKLNYSDGSGIVLQRHIDFYQRRNKDIGAITVEPLYMDKGLREIPGQLGIDNDNKIAGLIKLNDVIHQNGAKSIAHLNHPGRMSNPKIPNNYWLSSTEKACENGGAIPKKMTHEMMDDVIELFIESAKRAVLSGFDIIELQFGHGYLMSQFLSPAVNNRNDEYGGSFENRALFPLKIAKAVRNAVNIPIIARISGDEMFQEGLHIDEMIRFSQLLKNIGIDVIHVSTGSVCSTPPWFFQHMFIKKGKTWELASQIKSKVDIPVIFVGRVNSKLDVDQLKKHFNADYIAIGRAMIADPDFVGKYTNEIPGFIRPCLACEEGCLGGVKSGKGLSCVVNPEVNTSYKHSTTSISAKRYAVIGGGLAGMQTSITLSKRGHSVDLYEKGSLGGQFILASLPPQKESLKDIINYYKNELKSDDNKQINLIKKEATSDLIKIGSYDGVIMATGAIPSIPHIKGLKKYFWTEFLEDDQLPKNSKVLIIGGGLIGLEIASKLVDDNNEVIVIEMLGELARGMEMIEKNLTIKKLKAKNAKLMVNHKVIEIDGDRALILGDGKKKEILGIKHIVVAVGMRSYIPFENISNIPFYFVGDAKKVSNAKNAIHGAYKLAVSL